METRTINITGIPGFWTFAFVHPWLFTFVVCFLILAIFGTITDVGVALANKKEDKK